MKYLKRVHIDTHFVLTFNVNKEKNFILFVDFDHHDNIYWMGDIKKSQVFVSELEN